MNRYAIAAEAAAQWAEHVFRDNLIAVVHFGSSACRIRFHRPHDIDIAVIVEVTQTAQALRPPTSNPPTHLHVLTLAEIVSARDSVRTAITHGRILREREKMPPIIIKPGYRSTSAALNKALRPEGLRARLVYDDDGYFRSLAGFCIVAETQVPRRFLFWHWSTACTRRVAQITVFPGSPVRDGSGDRIEIVVRNAAYRDAIVRAATTLSTTIDLPVCVVA